MSAALATAAVVATRPGGGASSEAHISSDAKQGGPAFINPTGWQVISPSRKSCNIVEGGNICHIELQ